MAHPDPSKAKKKPGKDGKGDAFKAEDVLQAIIIADSFNQRFKPITLQTPRALLPVANCPTIEYTLDFLAGVGVQEIFIFCRAHADKIRQYIEGHWKWGTKGRRHRSVLVRVIVSENCYSMGDALRDIDARNLMRSDFILVQGDLIANVDLKPALEAHRQRRTSDKNSIMTMVCREVAPRHPARSLEDQIVLTVEPSTSRVLHYQTTGNNKKIQFPLDVLENRDDVEIRCDLLDCHISICSPLVPPLFSDNFDYLTRDDFIRGILVNEEILGNTIHCFLLTAGYTARISNLHMYDVVSRDIIARWVYPFCPDLGFPNGDAYFYKRHHIYYQKDVQLSMGSVLEENVIVGLDSTIAENTKIRDSVIGNNCIIGRDCDIDGSYIWDSCVIEDGCKLRKCILANGCRVGKNSIIEAGCIISYDVAISPGTTVPCGVRIIGKSDHQITHRKDQDEESEESFEIKPVAESCFDSKGTAWTFEMVAEDPESDDESDAGAANFERLCWNWASVENVYQEDDYESDTTDEDSDAVDSCGHQINDMPVVDDSRLFFNEVSDSLMRAVEENVGSDNVVLEINSSKFAYNVTMGELNKLVVRSILEIPELRARQKKKSVETKADVMVEIQATFKALLPVLRNYFRSGDSQLDALYAVEECAINYEELQRHQPYGKFLHQSFTKIVHFLYNEEILEESVIIKWHSQVAKQHVRNFIPFYLHELPLGSPRRRHQSGDLTEEEISSLIRKVDELKQQIQPLITWFTEAEEEESE